VAGIPYLLIAKGIACLFHVALEPAHCMPDRPAADSPDSPAPKGSASSKQRTLLNRSASTLFLITLVTVALWFSSVRMFLVIFTILSMGGLIEYFRLFPHPGFRRFRWLAFIAAGGYLTLLYSPLWGFTADWLGQLDSLFLALLTISMITSRLRSPLEGYRSFDEVAATLFGFTYCILLFSFVPKILLLPALGTGSVFYLVYLVAVTKLTDIGAYLVGSAIGKDKLVPQISPGKTWQGFWGALFFAVSGSYAFYFIAGDQIPLITAVHAGVLGLLIALVAVLGDLAESIIKRSLAVKDSGHVMPGIGGFLDLIDSVIFTAPIFYFYLLLVN
jgi:phosphatidate cytidylyltransferase